MPWITILSGYLLGSIPTAYIAGRLLKDIDIRQVGDGNMGAQNAFHHLGKKIGIAVFLVDAGKGVLAVLIARAASQSEVLVMLSGAAAVLGHNWPVFLGFRGGRGEATTIGVLLTVITFPLLIMLTIGLMVLVRTRNVIAASAAGFIPLPVVCWLLGYSPQLAAYGVALPCLVGLTHFLRARHATERQA
ncbi:MAG: glycerol-3-phosphate acyltransferase [Chloroflexi bacterium]|nr:glycerol-3-phosphate acyltransferase [Chloroflexota bacterium]